MDLPIDPEAIPPQDFHGFAESFQHHGPSRDHLQLQLRMGLNRVHDWLQPAVVRPVHQYHTYLAKLLSTNLRIHGNSPIVYAAHSLCRCRATLQSIRRIA